MCTNKDYDYTFEVHNVREKSFHREMILASSYMIKISRLYNHDNSSLW